MATTTKTSVGFKSVTRESKIDGETTRQFIYDWNGTKIHFMVIFWYDNFTKASIFPLSDTLGGQMWWDDAKLEAEKLAEMYREHTAMKNAGKSGINEKYAG